METKNDRNTQETVSEISISQEQGLSTQEEKQNELKEDALTADEIEKNLTRLTIGEGEDLKEVILIGTAHVSPRSAEIVKQVIETEEPDSVCVELDPGRFKTLKNPAKYQNTDIVKIIKSGRAGFFFANLILANYQRKLAEQFNIQSGLDMMQGIKSCEEQNANLVLADRDIQITFKRIWQNCKMKDKLKLLTTIVMTLFDNEEITEEDIEALKSEDMLTAALGEMAETFPTIKTTLVDERDQYLAEKIRTAPGKKVLAVLGAAHVPGITKELFKDHHLEELEELKPKSNTGKAVGWGITIGLIAMLIYTFSIDTGEGLSQTLNWLALVCGGATLGAILALASPLTILTSLVCAPLGAASPVLASGWFAGLMEAHVRKPRVKDFEDLPKDLEHISGLWKNRVMRILLVVVFVNLGCAVGNIIGSLGIIKGFLGTLF